MTPGEPFDCDPSTEQGTMALDRFQSVLGTGWMKAASRPKEGAHAVAVPPDQQRQYSDHRALVSKLATSASEKPFPVTRMRISQPPRPACPRRNHSRSTRFARLRSTARGNTRLGTMSPSLGNPRAFALRNTLKLERFKMRPPASKPATSSERSRCQR